MSTKIGFLITNIIAMMIVSAKKAEGGRAFFVFGDSLVDSGNNNYLLTTARANSYPYGIDHPSGRPSGRFSNGLNLPDIISQYIGSKPPLPYLSPHLKGHKLLTGANFASAGIGILNDTGVQFAEIIRMFQQFMLFEDYQERLREEVGEEEAERIVKGALVLITLGGNDMVNNYYLTDYVVDSIPTRSRQFSVSEFCHYLISEYRKILMRLFELGGRRVLVVGLGPLGCIPSILATRSKNGECVPEIQHAAQTFDSLLNQMTRELNTNVGSDVFITTTTASNLDFMTNPKKFGFVTTNTACCGQGRFNGMGLCTKLSNLCQNRDVYAYWDAFHPSQRALGFIVHEMFYGTSDFISPMNLSTIMAIDSHN